MVRFSEKKIIEYKMCVLGSALFWVITQGIVVILTDVSGQPIGPIF
jgi:hypothetical protein